MNALKPAVSTSSRPRAGRVPTMSIGMVIKQLKPDFPDVTVSKIRFLESEGLIAPARAESGYRRFTEKDVQRLRYILLTQRDHYTPLKIIRRQLDAMDAGEVTALVTANRADPVIGPEEFRAPTITRITDDDIAVQASVDPAFVQSLVDNALIVPDASGFFTADDVRIASTAHALKEFGFDIRHLKSVRNSARRQADLIGQLTMPVAHSRSTVAKHKANELSEQLSALVVSLHATLVKNELRR